LGHYGKEGGYGGKVHKSENERKLPEGRGGQSDDR